MATEYPLGPGDTHESLARDLLEQAADPNQVHWSPRPDVYGGGVYVLADEGIAQRVREVRAARRREEADRIAASQRAADERDSHPDVAEGLLTPAEAGFPANAVFVLDDEDGDAEVADGEPETSEAADDETEASEAADEDTPAERRLTPAQKRKAAREAQKQAEAEQAQAAEEKSE